MVLGYIQSFTQVCCYQSLLLSIRRVDVDSALTKPYLVEGTAQQLHASIIGQLFAFGPADADVDPRTRASAGAAGEV